MGLLFLNPVGEIGGAERSLLEMIRAVRRERSNVKVTLLAGGEGPLLDRAAELGADVVLLPMPAQVLRLGEWGMRGRSGLRNLFEIALISPRTTGALGRYLGRLRKEIRSLAPDVVHSNGLKTHLLAALAGPRDTPMLWHVHDFLSRRPLMRRILRSVASRACRAIAVSQSVAADARAVLGNVPVTTIYNVVDTARFHPDGLCADLDRLANLNRAPTHTLRIGLTATYARWKGHDVFLRAAGHWLRSAPQAPVRFYIIGGPIYQTGGSQFSLAELRQLARAEGLADRVAFVPFQDETAPVYRSLDIAVHASVLPEPFGLTIAEAMACGRAVVFSKAGGAAELFTADREAIGVPPGDALALAEAIQRIAADKALRQRLGANARSTVLRKFNPDRLGPQLLAVYEAMIAMR
jgi:glycosyltransferase involved in cell wall biosynthesis